jgi:hypothetical protein
MVEHTGRNSGLRRYVVPEVVDHPWSAQWIIVVSGFGERARGPVAMSSAITGKALPLRSMRAPRTIRCWCPILQPAGMRWSAASSHASILHRPIRARANRRRANVDGPVLVFAVKPTKVLAFGKGVVQLDRFRILPALAAGGYVLLGGPVAREFGAPRSHRSPRRLVLRPGSFPTSVGRAFTRRPSRRAGRTGDLAGGSLPWASRE